MKKFMVLYHGPADTQQNQNPEDQKKGREDWNTWAQALGNNLVDPGSPLPNGQGFSNSGNLSGFKSDVTGYSFIQAENLEKAQALLKNHPYLQNDKYSIELREAMEMPTDLQKDQPQANYQQGSNPDNSKQLIGRSQVQGRSESSSPDQSEQSTDKGFGGIKGGEEINE